MTALNLATALAPDFYVAPQYLEFEQTNILATHWQLIAPMDQLRDVGDVIARDIGSVPIVVVRSAQDEVRGFINVCAHRAGPLVTKDAHGQQKFTCRYHGWTYDFAGRLLNAPQMRNAEGFDPTCVHLTPIETCVWGGLLFARLNKGPQLSEMVEGILDTMGYDPFPHLIHARSLRYEVASNWKVYVDNFLEGYHLPFVHPRLTQAVEVPNYRTQLGEWWSLQHSPVPKDTAAYAQGEGFYFFIYPNTMLNFMPGRLQTNRVVPTDHQHCQVEFDFYYSDEARWRLDEDVRFSEEIQEEDRQICERVQKALASGYYTPGRLSPDKEAAVWQWQERLRSQYAASGQGA